MCHFFIWSWPWSWPITLTLKPRYDQVVSEYKFLAKWFKSNSLNGHTETQTDTQIDPTEIITYPHTRMVKIESLKTNMTLMKMRSLVNKAHSHFKTIKMFMVPVKSNYGVLVSAPCTQLTPFLSNIKSSSFRCDVNYRLWCIVITLSWKFCCLLPSQNVSITQEMCATVHCYYHRTDHGLYICYYNHTIENYNICSWLLIYRKKFKI